MDTVAGADAIVSSPSMGSGRWSSAAAEGVPRGSTTRRTSAGSTPARGFAASGSSASPRICPSTERAEGVAGVVGGRVCSGEGVEASMVGCEGRGEESRG